MDEAGQLRMLLDRAEISDVVHRYATALDTRDWPLLRSIFLDQFEADMSSIGLPKGRMDADRWVADTSVLFAGFDATQHLSANHVYDLRGDEATCTSYMRAEHFVLNHEGENYYTMGGYYVDDLVRTATGWKISAITLNATWNRGNRHVLRLALLRGRERAGR